MREKWKNMTAVRKHYYMAFFISLAISLGLLIGGFCCPPPGEISNSVLEATGIVFLWPSLAFAAKALEEGNKAKIKHNNTTITLGMDDDGDESEETDGEVGYESDEA